MGWTLDQVNLLEFGFFPQLIFEEDVQTMDIFPIVLFARFP